MDYSILEIVYIEGTDADFVVFIKSLGDTAELVGIDGHFRWVITRDDGTKYIARPHDAK